MTQHIKQHWPLYTIVLQLLYIIMNPGPIHSLLRLLLCND